jgi:hypothetical protein
MILIEFEQLEKYLIPLLTLLRADFNIAKKSGKN